MKQIHKFITN